MNNLSWTLNNNGDIKIIQKLDKAEIIEQKRQAREILVKLIFEYLFNSRVNEDLIVELLEDSSFYSKKLWKQIYPKLNEEFFQSEFQSQMNDISETTNVEPTNEELYVSDSYFGIINNLNRLNSYIDNNLVGFAPERIFKIDRAIMLVAIYEIIFKPDIDYKVSVNEAINLAKKYSTEKSSKFINGILSKVEKPNGNN